jgi:hypothetical protein
MNPEKNIQVNFHEYLPKNITIQMNMNFDFSNSRFFQLNIWKISKNAIQVESIPIYSNQRQFGWERYYWHTMAFGCPPMVLGCTQMMFFGCILDILITVPCHVVRLSMGQFLGHPWIIHSMSYGYHVSLLMQRLKNFHVHICLHTCYTIRDGNWDF